MVELAIRKASEVASLSGGDEPCIVRFRDVCKSYGPTFANRHLSFELPRGGIIGLAGANGAGKSTLMRILSGVETPDSGAMEFDGVVLDPARFDPREAGRLGIRIVHQELSLCSNLSVLENFYLEDPIGAGTGLGWRRALAGRVTGAIESVFPGANINPRAKVADLSLAQRQMVEIARAASDPSLKVMILDEPTSSLDSSRSEDLIRYMRARSDRVTFIFITHKLREIIAAASSVLVMRNGGLVWQGEIAGTSIGHLIGIMGGTVAAAGSSATRASAARVRGPDSHAEAIVTVAAGDPVNDLGTPITIAAGEVVGLAGLEGGGQREFLKRVHAEHKKRSAFVAGDRAREGVFPGETVQFNAIISSVVRRGATSYCSPADERRRLAPWFERLHIAPERAAAPILELSGGNQQKALMARALVTDAPLVLLDDPTRGVDVGVKQELYAIVGEMAGKGTAFLWCSTEDAEFLQCQRVIVFRKGRAVAHLTGDEISESAIVAASFGDGHAVRSSSVERRQPRRTLLDVLAPATLVVVLGLLAFLNPNTMTSFGLSLLLSAAVPVVFVAISQMFIVGGSEIDLSVGAFVGLISVLSATLLVQTPILGVLALLAAMLCYPGMSAIIETFRIPAIVVTLGASFIWLGIGYTIQLTPGGASPDWLTSIFSFAIPGIPAPVLIIAAAAAAASWINASKFGIVLRALGNNRRAVVQLGWPLLRYQAQRYGVASFFGACAGLSLTGVNGSSDVNAGSSFTLMSVASIVIGGSLLGGGWVRPLRTTFGAVTLSLVGAILGLLDVSSDYSPAIQGGLLVLILLLTALFRRGADA